MRILVILVCGCLLCSAPAFVRGEVSTSVPVAIPPAVTSVSATDQPAHAGPSDSTNSSFDPAASLKATAPAVPQASTADDSIESLQKKAEAGDAKSQTKLGQIYQAGKGVPINPDQAVEWYRKAADQGYAEGECDLGSCYSIGIGIKRDGTEAVKWFHAAADQGDFEAMSELSYIYSTGFGVTQDKVEAEKWDREMVKAARKGADQGDATAKYYLGSCYDFGKGIEKNMIEAAKWYRKAAEQGGVNGPLCLATCYFRLALFYDKGMGVQKDDAEATKWYGKAAEQGFPAVLVTLVAINYRDGIGVDKDQVEAAKLFHLAADQGDPSAQYNLGLCYLNGSGVDKNSAEAAIWFSKAADQGDADGQNSVGYCYQYGIGVGKDATEAIKWYRRAADQNDATAQCNLGLLFIRGLGVMVNDVEGLAWLYVSSANGDEQAAEFFSSQQKNYNDSTISTARQRATEIQAQIAAHTTSANNSPAISQPTPASNAPKESGSGAFISADGLVLTAAHVVQGASRIEVITAAGTLAATVVKIDATNDVALLKCTGSNFTPLPIAPSKEARAGATVFTVGFPNIQVQGFDPKLTKGEISSQTGFQDDPREWQISVPIQPGNSGGPLCDENGNLIGIVESTLDPLAMAKMAGEIPQNVNYAMKSSYILPLLDEVQNLPQPRVAVNGQKFEDVVDSVRPSTVLILVY
jgi:TPR repeat protein